MKFVEKDLRMQSESSSRATDNEILAIESRHMDIIWREKSE